MSRALRALRDRAPRAVHALDLPGTCELPQLAAIVEPGRLARALGDALAGAGPGAPVLLRCDVTKVHYRPGRDCRLVISARFRSGRRGEEQLYFGKLHIDKPLVDKPLAGARGPVANGQENGHTNGHENGHTNGHTDGHANGHASHAAPRFGPASLHLADWDLRLWAYPNDPDLPGLPLLADTDRVLERFASEPEVFGFERAPRALLARRAKYVPGRRCGYAYDVRGWSTRARAAARRVYGKCYVGSAARIAHEAAWRVWHSAPARDGRLRVPRPFACDEALGITWQEGLAGRPILKERAHATHLPGIAAEIGQRLAALHGAVLPLPREMDHASQLAMLGGSLAGARASGVPATRAACDLGARLLALGSRFPELPAVTLHGSFRLSHILETPEGIAFIDLDGANGGDPGVDLGRFLAHLRRLEAQGSIAPTIAETAAREFRRGYQAAAPVRVSDERIGWATAVHLISGGLDKALKRMDAHLLAALTSAAAESCPA